MKSFESTAKFKLKGPKTDSSAEARLFFYNGARRFKGLRSITLYIEGKGCKQEERSYVADQKDKEKGLKDQKRSNENERQNSRMEGILVAFTD